jgi:hypothetical protein
MSRRLTRIKFLGVSRQFDRTLSKRLSNYMDFIPVKYETLK